jgi:PAS domain S-box-containing protein
MMVTMERTVVEATTVETTTVGWLAAATRREIIINSLLDLQAIVEHALAGITIADRETGEIIYANHEAAEILGLSRDDVRMAAGTLVELIYLNGDPFPISETAVMKARRSGQRERATFGVKYPDGSVRWVSSKAEPRILPDGTAVIVANLMGITDEIKGQQEQLEAQRERLELAELQQNAIDNLSHEIRTPLNLIMGYADLLLHGTVPDDRIAHTLGIIHREAKAVEWMAETLLWLGKLESGSELAFEPLDLTAVVRYRADAISLLAEREQVALIIAGELPACRVSGHETLLSLAIGNLVGNAIKFTKYSETRQVTVSLEVGEGEATVSVTDTGIGIKPEHLSLIFEKFRQLDGGSTRKFRGTGIGLHFVKLVAQAHGGRVEVESEFGKGSTFRLVLPLEVPPSA